MNYLGARNGYDLPDWMDSAVSDYVRWQAWQWLTSKEMQNPSSTSSLAMSLLAENASKARYAYYEKVRELKTGQAGQSLVVSWKMDGEDRVY